MKIDGILIFVVVTIVVGAFLGGSVWRAYAGRRPEVHQRSFE